MSTKHIISFSIPTQKENYKIYGECCIEIGTDLNGQSYPYPRFYDLKAEKIINNQISSYKPSGINFAGRHYDESDMIETVIAAAIRMDNTYVQKLCFGKKKLRKEHSL